MAYNTPSIIKVVYNGFILSNIWNCDSAYSDGSFGGTASASQSYGVEYILTRVTSDKVNIVGFQQGFELRGVQL